MNTQNTTPTSADHMLAEALDPGFYLETDRESDGQGLTVTRYRIPTEHSEVVVTRYTVDMEPRVLIEQPEASLTLTEARALAIVLNDATQR